MCWLYGWGATSGRTAFVWSDICKFGWGWTVSAPLFVLQLNPFKLLVGGAERLALSDVCSFWVPIFMFRRDKSCLCVETVISLYVCLWWILVLCDMYTWRYVFCFVIVFSSICFTTWVYLFGNAIIYVAPMSINPNYHFSFQWKIMVCNYSLRIFSWMISSASPLNSWTERYFSKLPFL